MQDADNGEAAGQTVERPARIRQEDRDRLEEQSRMQEEMGRLIERQRDQALDAGTDVPDFNTLKARAEAQLFQAAEGVGPGMPPPGMQAHDRPGTPPQGHGTQRVCFREDGSVTTVREECDWDQSRHFGVEEQRGEYEQRVEERFEGFQPQAGPSDDQLIMIVSEALDRLSQMIGPMRNNPAALEGIQETISYLSGVLRDYGSGATPGPEVAEEVRVRLELIMRTMDSQDDPGGGGFGHGGMPEDMNHIMDMMETMIGKLPQVIAIFEEEGIPVAPEARAAAADAIAAFARLKEPCRSGDMESCKQLGEMMSGIDQRMRPPMEAAMMASGNQEAMIRIHALMDEGMENSGPPPMNGHRGPPPEMMRDRRGPPASFDPSQFQNAPHKQWRDSPPPGGMQQGYGPPPNGMHQGSYGPPSGYQHSEGWEEVPSQYDTPYEYHE